MGETMQPKRTPAIGVGKTVRLTVTLTAGKYHMWDPVTSSMSHAKFITVKAPAMRAAEPAVVVHAAAGRPGAPARAAAPARRAEATAGRRIPAWTAATTCDQPSSPAAAGGDLGRAGARVRDRHRHPSHLVVGESDRLFLAIHLAFPFVICLLAWALYLLVDGVENAAATAVRVLVIPFAVAYTTFEAVAGIARGAFIWKAEDLTGDRQLDAAS